MPTIIDSLVLELDLDDAKLASKRKKADRDFDKTKESMRKGGKQIEEGARRSAEGFAALRKEVIGLFAVFTAGVGLKNFVEGTVRSDAAVGRLSKQIGVSTEELSAWQGVLKRNGGSAEGATSALGTLTNAYEEFLTTGRTSLPYLSLLGSAGLRLEDLGKPTEGLLKIADIFSRMDPRKAALIGRSLGFDEATINLLTKGRAAVQAQLDQQAKIAVVTKQQAENAQRLQNAYSSLAQGSANLGRQLLNWLAPALETVGSLLGQMAEWAGSHATAVRGAFIGLGVVAAGLGIALAAPIAPFIALALAAAAFGAGVAQLADESPEVREALSEVASSASELWDTLQAIASWVDAHGNLGQGIKDFFGPAGPAADALASAIRGVADALKLVNDASHGHVRSAWKDAGNVLGDAAGAVGLAPSRGPGEAKAPVTGNLVARSAGVIKGFEGFRSKAYWDRTAFRAGYGSDTVTDPRTGEVRRVTKSTVVTREMAEADLQRRLRDQYIPRLKRDVGAAWDKLDDATRASLTSVAYNYGHLPKEVRDAARRGDRAAIAAAISARASDNKGINAGRRRAEASAVLAANQNIPPVVPVPGSPLPRGAAPALAAGRATGATVTNTMQTGDINIHTQATDAEGIARTIGPAIQRRSFVTQANSGLG